MIDPAARIKHLRKSLNLSQEAFAKLLHASRRAVQYWETGERDAPPYALYLIEYRAAHATPEELDELRRAGRR